MRSISRSRSSRQLGANLPRPAVLSIEHRRRSHPSALSTPSTVAAVIPSSSTVLPRMRCTSLSFDATGLRRAVRSSMAGTRTSTSSPSIDPPLASRIALTSAEATGAALKSAPRSKRWLASVCSPWRRAVCRTATGSNHAASTSTFFVSEQTNLMKQKKKRFASTQVRRVHSTFSPPDLAAGGRATKASAKCR